MREFTKGMIEAARIAGLDSPVGRNIIVAAKDQHLAQAESQFNRLLAVQVELEDRTNGNFS